MLDRIEAVFRCDHCASAFSVEIDPATTLPVEWTPFDIAEDAIRGGLRGTIGKSGNVSVQGGKHLCPDCTTIVDDYGPEDRSLTVAEVNAALAASATAA